MKKTTVPTALVGIAGVHYVAAELSRRGLIALPTIRNTAGYDIIVATPDGKKHANIQVKTSLKEAKFWMMPPADKVRTMPNDYYVLVRWVEREKRFEAFMVAGAEAEKEVAAEVKRQEEKLKVGRHGKKLYPSIPVWGTWAQQEKRWRSQWDTWGL
jgi:hypothetical protein